MATTSSAISSPHNVRQIAPQEEQAEPSAVTIIGAKINEYFRYSRECLEGWGLGKITDAAELHPFIATSLKNVGKVALIGGALLLGLKYYPAWTALIGLWWAMSNIATTPERIEPKATRLSPPKIISADCFSRALSSSSASALAAKPPILGASSSSSSSSAFSSASALAVKPPIFATSSSASSASSSAFSSAFAPIFGTSFSSGDSVHGRHHRRSKSLSEPSLARASESS